MPGSMRTNGPQRRRRARRGDLTEAKLLETARLLLADRPLSVIAIDELARGAGISRPSFYFYFESREALLRELAGRISHEFFRAADHWLRRGGESVADAVRRANEATLALRREHGPVLRAIHDARPADPAMRELWDEVGRHFITEIAGQIDRERRAGTALAGPPATMPLATVLVEMNDRAFYEASGQRLSARAQSELIDTLSTVWLRSIYGTDEPGSPGA